MRWIAIPALVEEIGGSGFVGFIVMLWWPGIIVQNITCSLLWGFELEREMTIKGVEVKILSYPIERVCGTILPATLGLPWLQTSEFVSLRRSNEEVWMLMMFGETSMFGRFRIELW
jgi:hypothetical protein